MKLNEWQYITLNSTSHRQDTAIIYYTQKTSGTFSFIYIKKYSDIQDFTLKLKIYINDVLFNERIRENQPFTVFFNYTVLLGN